MHTYSPSPSFLKRPGVSSTLSDILTPGVVGVPANAPMKKALECMRHNRISSILVMKRGSPVGILTERGIIAAVGALGRDVYSRNVTELMSSPVLTAAPDTPIHQAFTTLMEQGIRHLVVVDAKGKALGMVTQTNMVQNLGVEYFVDVKRVHQIMTRSVASLDISQSVQAAFELMMKVVFLADRLDLAATPISLVMSRPVVTITGMLPVHQAAEIMRDKTIRRLVVTDESGRAVGLLTQSDIIKGMEARYVEMLKEVIREKDQLLKEAVHEAARKSDYLDTIMNSSMDMGIAATEGDSIVFMNQAARNILGGMGGESSDEAQGDLFDFHKRMGISARRVKSVIAKVRRGSQHSFSAKLDSKGCERYLDCCISGIMGEDRKSSGYVVLLRDVTERHLAEETIKHMAYHDALTGLPNRFLASDRLEQGLAQAKRRGCLLAVMLLDLDGFKMVNDTLGHNVGDLLLRSVAAKLDGLLRRSDTVARMGGDEFLVILPEVKTPEGVASVASKMLKAVREIRSVGGCAIRMSTSAGLAMYPWDGDEPQTLIQRADAALYAAKDAGRDTYRFATDKMDV
ncbi:MAG: PAS/PAC sensor-containing diguanylate [Desulfovibrionaceae bacterium]|nr:MAG: PAS/PAC sensor-containing diguanylate [Desulfovibrionaceae bacterium]